MTAFVPLTLAVTAFVALHFVLSSIPIRSRLVARLGSARFSILYAIIILAVFGWMIREWIVAPHLQVWSTPPWTRWVAFFVMMTSVFFLVVGHATPNPTAAGRELRLEHPDAVHGVLRITRHPALWGFALWGVAHLIANGDLRSVLMMGGVVVLALGGMLHIDRRRAHAHGEAWEAFLRRTSVVPFAAVLAGRQRLALGEIGAGHWLATVGTFIALLVAHGWIIGVSAWPS